MFEFWDLGFSSDHNMVPGAIYSFFFFSPHAASGSRFGLLVGSASLSSEVTNTALASKHAGMPCFSSAGRAQGTCPLRRMSGWALQPATSRPCGSSLLHDHHHAAHQNDGHTCPSGPDPCRHATVAKSPNDALGQTFWAAESSGSGTHEEGRMRASAQSLRVATHAIVISSVFCKRMPNCPEHEGPNLN